MVARQIRHVKPVQVNQVLSHLQQSNRQGNHQQNHRNQKRRVRQKKPQRKAKGSNRHRCAKFTFVHINYCCNSMYKFNFTFNVYYSQIQQG